MEVIVAKALQKQMDKDAEIAGFVQDLVTKVRPLSREQISASGLQLEKKHTRKNRIIWTIRVNAGDRVYCGIEGSALILNEFFQHDAMMRFLRNGSDLLAEVLARIDKNS